MKVYIKYSFIFDPKDTWKYKDELDKDLALFFGSKGFEVEVIRSGKEDMEQEAMLYISRVKEEVPKEISVKQKINKLTQKRSPEGRYSDGRPRRRTGQE